MTADIITLDSLPPEHPDRNKPLVGCYYRWRMGKIWNEIKPAYSIAKATFNQLGASWRDNDLFSWNPYGQ